MIGTGMGRGLDYMSELFNSELFIITEICTSSLKLSFSLSRFLVRYNIVRTSLIAILTSFSLYSVIADFGVCPFTIDKNRAGIPMGGVRYK